MMRLPKFAYCIPKTLEDAVKMKADAGNDSMFVAGGTDLYPNMKRRQQTPKTVTSVMRLEALQSIKADAEARLTIGAGVLLNDLCENKAVAKSHTVVAEAAKLISTPLLLNMGTI